MPTLHVRNVPDALYEEIRTRAEAGSRSFSAEVVVLLQRAVEERRPSPGEILQQIRRRRSFRPAAVGAPGTSSLLREDRER